MEDTNNTLVIRVKKKHIQSNRLDNTPIQNDIIIKDDVISHQKNKNLKQKTQKKKSNLSEVDKSKLWEAFDVDNQDIHTNTSSAYNNQMECLYENSVNQIKESGICGFCDGILVISEEGFPICSNNSCGIIYKNTLDYSPEWRFYGADDKNTNDPTRCGNPINPLLVESSFGCKVLCSTKSTYEMRKIRKWTEWQSMPHKEKS
jgi:hypothetical protein